MNPSSNKSIDVLCTGGTFEKVYGSGAGVRNFSFPAKSAVEAILARFGVSDVPITYIQAQAKDSLDMNENDRYQIALYCINGNTTASVVIHGTDTMIETAGIIHRHIAKFGSGTTTSHAVQSYLAKKVVVLTGALQPACMRESDAEFNLGGALVAAQTCPPGVFIVMGGRIYPWDKCKKNPTTGHFESI